MGIYLHIADQNIREWYGNTFTFSISFYNFLQCPWYFTICHLEDNAHLIPHTQCYSCLSPDNARSQCINNLSNENDIREILVWKYIRAKSRLASQWETSLQNNTVSHRLGANLESTLYTESVYQLTRNQHSSSTNAKPSCRKIESRKYSDHIKISERSVDTFHNSHTIHAILNQPPRPTLFWKDDIFM